MTAHMFGDRSNVPHELLFICKTRASSYAIEAAACAMLGAAANSGTCQ
jgi:hypothetical protein